MNHTRPDGLLDDLRGKFELVLEDYAALSTEMLALREEARRQHELTGFLLKALAADLARHCSDREAHAGARRPAAEPRAGQPVHLIPCPTPP